MIKNDELTEKVIACAYKVHSELGAGFSERVYHNALVVELDEKKISHETEKQHKVVYHKKQVGILRMDLIVDNKVVVEVKAITGFLPKVFEAQVLSYLKITGYNVALLINFGNKSCEVRRLVAKSL